ncbi:hypothetical protein GCM10025794_02500 [Massilia kyonggiensis]|nr:hypothetical protein [Massilia kyonggiensis]
MDVVLAENYQVDVGSIQLIPIGGTKKIPLGILSLRSKRDRKFDEA